MKFFSLFKKRKKNTKSTDLHIPPNKGFEEELALGKKKLKNFFLTQQKNSGVIIERSSYKLIKNNDQLFKLEGSPKNGPSFSIVISTGSFLKKSENQISGIFEVSEIELNRMISREYKNLDEIVKSFSSLELDENSMNVLGDNKHSSKDIKNWKKILDWPLFWKQQIITQLRPSYLALLLVLLDNKFQEFFKMSSTKKQQKIISDELYFLNQGGSGETVSPNTENLSLLDGDKAKVEFMRVVKKIEKKMKEQTK